MHRRTGSALVTASALLAVIAVATIGLGGPSFAASPTPATSATSADGSLALTNPDARAGDDLVFRYSTDAPAAKNWIGVYDTPSDGPTDQSYHAPSTAYAYTGDNASGTLTVSGAKVTAGHEVTAYLLSNDGYSWLAKPITFTLAASTGTPPAADGALTLDTTDPTIGDPLTFSYRTARPNAKNWIGLYNDPSDGPTDQRSHGSSTVWTYVGSGSGTATIPSGALTSGHDIAAYLLYDDGYTWLATPITFTVKDPPPFDPQPTTAHFVLDDVTQPASPPNTRLRTPIGGYWFGADGSTPATPPTFTKTGGADWLRISSSGVITGTTPAEVKQDADPGLIEVHATDASGVSGDATIEFPLVPRGTPSTVKAATLSEWDGGSHVQKTQEKLVATILRNRLDAVGLQDAADPTTHADTAVITARLLGWSRAGSGGVDLLSRFPLSSVVAPKGLPAVSARADVDGHGVRLWSAALDPDDFGPAAACSGYRGDLVLREKASLRYQQATALVAEVKSARASGIPDILLGALWSPAASDWTKGTAAQHCGHAPVAWPVPDALAKAKLVDAFRTANPDPRREPGATQLFTPAATATTDSAERIDYVDYAGRLAVAESHALVDGFPQAPPSTAGNAWISNRAAVVATFTVVR